MNEEGWVCLLNFWKDTDFPICDPGSALNRPWGSFQNMHSAILHLHTGKGRKEFFPPYAYDNVLTAGVGSHTRRAFGLTECGEAYVLILCSLCIYLEKKLKLLTSFPELQRKRMKNTRRLLENHFIILIIPGETEAHGKVYQSPTCLKPVSSTLSLSWVAKTTGSLKHVVPVGHWAQRWWRRKAKPKVLVATQSSHPFFIQWGPSRIRLLCHVKHSPVPSS